jgi:hypothetical protein
MRGARESFHRVGEDDSEEMGDALCVTGPGLELALRMSGMMVFGVGAGSVPDEPIRARAERARAARDAGP